MLDALRGDLAAAFGLLTRVPAGWLVPRGLPWRPGRAVWCYPLAGLLVGGAVAAVRALAARIGLPPLVGAVWAVGAGMLLTGALHEDGLADAADGLGGGSSRERRLEIMRDSRIGSFGTLALILSSIMRVCAVAALPAGDAVADLLAAGAASRAAMLPVLALLPPARLDGLARALGRPPLRATGLGLGLAVAMLLALLPVGRAAAAVGLGAAVAGAIGELARRRLGGHTGDVLGAVCVVTECGMLTLLAGAVPAH